MINGLMKIEKEGWEAGGVENVEFAGKDLPLGRTLWLIEVHLNHNFSILQSYL